MLVTHQERPRELNWYHAGPLLYGDWGTSRFYVLGLAFYYALFSSFWYILGVGLLVTAVGWAYTVVCRVYPDGGGVYSAARQISPGLAVVGALLLFADYSVTAALSAFDGVHYLGIENAPWVQIAAILSILFLGALNYVGARKAGTFALVVAMATMALTLVMACFAIPHLGSGWAHVQPMHGSVSHRWLTLVNVVLALSGVEAVANMTGIMVPPVARTSKKSIWPVLAEVVLLNLFLGVAMLALPPLMQQRGHAVPGEFSHPGHTYDEPIRQFKQEHPGWEKSPELKAQLEALPEKSKNQERMKNVVMRVMAEQFVHPWFGVAAGVVFGLLLISAVNTVIGGMISVAYVMARDQELPRFFSRLNLFGVPWAGLIPALVVPCILLVLFRDLELLADLYAIGVVGAIAINLCCCTVNRALPIRAWERTGIGLIAAVMIAIELTLAAEKFHALVFVGIVLATGLSARLATRARRAKPAPVPAAGAAGAPLSALEAFATPPEQLDMSRSHVMVATRGGRRLIDFAAEYTKNVKGILFVTYVRQFSVGLGAAAERPPRFEEDAEARRVFEMAAEACQKAGVQMVPIYVVSPDVADAILDFAATYSVSALLMGVSRQGTLLRALRGDVLTAVADNLPQDIPLLIHA